MKKIKLFAMLFIAAMSMQSCLDFDDPGDEYTTGTQDVDDTIYQGDVDKIDYEKAVSAEEASAALMSLDTYLRQAKGGIYAMRGGKQGNYPGEHSYQRQFTLGPDNYAQYAVVPHTTFMYGNLNSTYHVSEQFNGGPYSCYNGEVKNSIVPLLNHPDVDKIPEIKAIYLLMFNYASQEVADLFGPFPYVDYKGNKQESPFKYDDLRTIYVNIMANLNTIEKCLKHFSTKPAEYQEVINNALFVYLPQLTVMGDISVDNFIKFNNCLKLRMAIHIAKVDPEMAKTWAEEAVASGVIDNLDDEIEVAIEPFGISHPLLTISGSWGDTRMSASLESILMSLDHPYVNYAFTKNTNNLASKSDPSKVTPTNTRIVGIREGARTGEGQSYDNNPYIAYSQISKEHIASAPLYLMKLSEVCFLRAEGALRGWNMGGSAEQFYNDGIRYANFESREFIIGNYDEKVDEYMARESAVDYTWTDPQGISPDEPSVTKIGVKWNEGDSPEVKLEKIITQKYIASFPYSFEAWVDMRRTGYPKVFPVLNAEDGDGSLHYGDLIRRIPFALTDDASLLDINETGLSALGGPDLQATRLWWDVEGASNF